MRQIKFRAWNSKEKMMMDELYTPEVRLNAFLKDPFENGEYTLMQFTGLLDKNGKEIWEGDVLRDDQKDLFEVRFGKLPLDKSGDCVCTYEAWYAKGYGQLGCAPYHECNIIGQWMEIIGNIYENSELLKS